MRPPDSASGEPWPGVPTPVSADGVTVDFITSIAPPAPGSAPIPDPSAAGPPQEMRGAPPLAGPAAERYVIEAEIGRGGMGAVYRAFDRHLARRVALKAVLNTDASFAALFVEEARATAQLQHPGIVPVYDIGFAAPPATGLFFTMKLVEGRTLANLVRSARAEAPELREFTPFRLLQIFVEIARTVAYAHERGIIHRDLKPDNVMIGSHGEVQVMDWGLAKAVGERGPGPSASGSGDDLQRAETLAGQVKGTPSYMAPEQARGDPSRIGAPADVYALGATLYHTLTSRAPFEGGPVEGILKRVLGAAPLRPRHLDRRVPREIEAICLKAMAKAPEARYPSARALADDVQAFLEHRPVSAHPEGLARRAAKFARRHRRAVGAAFLVLVALGAGIGLAARARSAAARREHEALVAAASDRARIARARLERDDSLLPAEDLGAAERRRRLDRRLGLALDALRTAESYLALAPEAAGAREQAFAAALALGRLAKDAEEWSLAENAFEKARALELDLPRVEAELEGVERARSRVAEDHRQAVERVLADARSGRLVLRPDAYDDALFKLVSLSEPQTVSLVAAALERASGEIRAAKRQAYLEAAAPNGDEERAGGEGIPGLEAALDRVLSLEPGEAPDEKSAALVRSAERRLGERAARGGYHASRPFDARWVLAAAEERRLGPGGVSLARLSCEALGRIGIREGALEALGRYLAAEDDELRAIPCGVALLRLGGERAEAILRSEGALRFAAGGSFARRVSPQASTGAAEPVSSGAEDLVELDPGLPQPWARRGIARIRAGEAAEGLLDLSRAIEIDPRFAQALRERGIARSRRGDLAGAIADLSRAIEIVPEDAAALLARGDARRLLGDVEGAIADYTRALELDPGSARALAGRARARAARGDLDLALADSTRAIELDPGLPQAWNARALAKRLKRDPEGAIADCTRAIELDPALASAWDGRGSARLKDDPGGAIEDCTRAIEIDRRFAMAWYHRGHARSAKGDLEGAIADFTEAIAIDPRDPSFWNRRGRARADRRDLAGAIADYDRAIELDPQFFRALANRGAARREKGDLAGALADYDLAIEIDPRQAWCFAGRGSVRAERGELVQAIADYGRAIDVDPTYAPSYARRADARVRGGDREGAVADLERFLELAPRSGEAAAARARLEGLRGEKR
jgi:tetratricopeptide (TPR) repeat protein